MREAMDAVVQAARAMKQAKRRGIDVKPYKMRMKEAWRAFKARDYHAVIDTAERIIADLTGSTPRSSSEAPKQESEFVCSACGGDISEEATTCPHCGEPIIE